MNRFHHLLAVSALCITALTVPAPDAHAQTLLNPGFETPSVGDYAYNPAGAGWTFLGTSGIGSSIGSFSSGFVTPDGVQVAFLQMEGSFSQDFTLSDAVSNFSVNFLASQRGGNLQTFSVALGGTPLGFFQPAGGAYQEFSTAPIDVAAGTYTLTFTGTNLNGGGDNTAVIDSVRLTSGPAVVPEAGTFALALPALGLAGAVVVRRRRRRNK